MSRRRTSLVDRAERVLRGWLQPGRFRPGDRLPPENELAAMLEVSRGTLRTALRRLERTGEIVRRQGSGTFVGRLEERHDGTGPLRVDSYTARAARGSLSLAALQIESGPIGTSAAAAFALGAGRPSTRMRRVLTVDAKPAAVAHDIFHPQLVLPDQVELRRELMSGRTVHDLLEDHGLPIVVSRTKLNARILTPREPLGRRLALRAATGCLVVEEVVVGSGGRPMLYSWDVIVPGMIEIEVVRSAGTVPPDPGTVRDRER